MILVFKLGIMLGVAVLGGIISMVFDTRYFDLIEELQHGPWFSQESYDDAIKSVIWTQKLSCRFFCAVILALEVIIWLKL